MPVKGNVVRKIIAPKKKGFSSQTQNFLDIETVAPRYFSAYLCSQPLNKSNNSSPHEASRDWIVIFGIAVPFLFTVQLCECVRRHNYRNFKLSDELVPLNFYFRNIMHGFSVLTIVNSCYQFMSMTCRCTASTHDSVEFCFRFGTWHKLEFVVVRFLNCNWCSIYMRGRRSGPCPKGSLNNKRGFYIDSFNYYYSSHRIHDEQLLGIIVHIFL